MSSKGANRAVSDEFERYEKLIGDKKIRSNMSLSQKIEIYGLWCVAARGKCTRPKPSRMRLVEYGKWAAWKKYEHLGKDKARKIFVERAKEILGKSKL
ncbi:unnamed protein product [Phytomonas sp. EM1]|nr:unnamed protein product [Phytomonas sp. EM1]|eukprot:CCW60665.1 unnamed protein product [Phytomonas sp. isolate EM1]